MNVKKGTCSFVATADSYGINSTANIEIGSATATAEFKSGTYKFNQTQIGKASGQTGTLKVSGGTFTSSSYLCVGAGGTGCFEISGGTVSNGGNDMPIGDSSTGTVTVKGSGKYVNAYNYNGYGIRTGCSGNGTLNVEGGEVELSGGALGLCTSSGKSVSGTVNITGGTVTTSQIKHGDGSGTGTLTIDGGTVCACADNVDFIPAHDNLNVYVGANGGTIDTNNKVIAIGEPLLEDATSTGGGMAFTGGGVVTLASGNTYTGKTTVEVGTTVHVPAPGEIGGVLAVSVPADAPANGFYTLLVCDGEGVFTDAVLTDAEAPEGATLSISQDGKSVLCTCGDGGPVWIGGTSGSLGDASNWANGAVPGAGTNCVIGVAGAATLTNPAGSAFAPASITFPVYSAVVTIDGEGAISGLSQIVNNSTNTVEFENAVTFAANVNVIQNTGAVKFTGGATGVQLGVKTDIHGTYNFTKTGNLTEISGTVVKSDGVYKLLDGTFYKHLGDFSVEAGGKVEVGDALINRNVQAGLLKVLNGEFKVNGEFSVAGGDATDFVTHYLVNDGGSGTLVANRIRVKTYGDLVPGGKTIIGGGGIIRGNGYIRVTNSGSHEFGSYGDWTFYTDALGNTTDGKAVFYKHNSTTATALTFDTTDYYDSTIGRTITGEALIGAYNAASAAAFSVAVKGKGRFVFANTSEGITTGTRPTSIFSGGLTVNDSATVEVMPNAWPGKGAVTMNGTSTLLMHAGGAARTGAITVSDGATLEVAESGTVTPGGNLTLMDGATLKFTFTERKTAPVLNMSSKAVTFGSTANITVALSGVRPASAGGGKYVLTSGGKFAGATVAKASGCPDWVKDVGVEDGDIYMTVARGFVIILN